MNGAALGAFLRAHRGLLDPADLGITGNGRRRTPGLRREEVAELAGVSVAWYTWLEQGRVSVSRQVIDAVCRALRLTSVDHDHALALAGFRAVPRAAVPDAALATMITAWPDSPALVLDERFDIVARNEASVTAWPEVHGNLLLLLTADQHTQHRVGAWHELSVDLFRQFRLYADTRPDDTRAAHVVKELLTARPDLSAWWQCRSVREFTPRAVEMRTRDGLRWLELALLRSGGGWVLVGTPVAR
ncbi:helix-turn-helix domain-containing protein [Kribbella sp. GL6]|uniref:helix-turn-helix domain-containing protein n=1 Tax=Kribbella sp. GL6 TaxID=3419765 RepID=UPI003CFF9E9C